jgi:putative glutamine amidotransferase
MKIALTYTGNPQKHQYYVDWLKENDAIDVVKLSADNDNLSELKNCNALVLSGGIDIHPKFYGGNINYPGAPENFNERRDEFEIASFNAALQNNMPILAICRGMQLINVIQKGTLIQDIIDGNINKIHKGNPDKQHSVIIKEGTLLHDITGKTFGEISTAHHQAVDKIGEELMINCIADDGTIEGIEWKDKTGKPFMLGIQWHPERMYLFQDRALSKTIRNQFIAAIQ